MLLVEPVLMVLQTECLQPSVVIEIEPTHFVLMMMRRIIYEEMLSFLLRFSSCCLGCWLFCCYNGTIHHSIVVEIIHDTSSGKHEDYGYKTSLTEIKDRMKQATQVQSFINL